MLASDSSPTLPPVCSETLSMVLDLSGPPFPHVHSWVMRAPAWRDGGEGGRKTHPWEGALSENQWWPRDLQPRASIGSTEYTLPEVQGAPLKIKSCLGIRFSGR